MMQESITKSAHETRSAGRSFARRLAGGTVIGLTGDLGAGKTEFVKGMAEGLGVTRLVQSPTFILMNVYPVRRRSIRSLVHVDCYRVHEPHDLIDVGLEDYLNDPTAVVVIEWADKIMPILPPDAVSVTFEVVGENERLIRIS